MTSVDGLTGGNITSATTITGNLGVSGNITVGGRVIVVRPAPIMAADIAIPGCYVNSAGLIKFGTSFATPPAFVMSSDNTVRGGSSMQTVLRRFTDRIGVQCAAAPDALHWIALETGVHVIDGKMVQAGRTPNVGNNAFVPFSQNFATPPVIVLTPDVGNQTPTLRLVNVLNSGFQIFSSGAGDINWIAFTPGDYTHGNLHWRAGVFALPASCPGGICANAFNPALPVSPGIVTTLYDSNGSAGNTNLTTYSMGISTTQYQWAIGQADVEFLDYVAFWKDE